MIHSHHMYPLCLPLFRFFTISGIASSEAASVTDSANALPLPPAATSSAASTTAATITYDGGFAIDPDDTTSYNDSWDSSTIEVDPDISVFPPLLQQIIPTPLTVTSNNSNASSGTSNARAPSEHSSRNDGSYSPEPGSHRSISGGTNTSSNSNSNNANANANNSSSGGRKSNERKVVNAGEWLRDGKVKARRRNNNDCSNDPDYTRDIGAYQPNFAPYREVSPQPNLQQQQNMLQQGTVQGHLHLHRRVHWMYRF